MSAAKRRGAYLLWGIAGIPIVLTALQVVFALLPRRAGEVAVVGTITGGIRSVEVFDEAAIVFEANPGVVFVLFVLVAAAWAVVGAAMWLGRRHAAFAAAGFVTLFVVLFLAAYYPLFGADVPLAQVVGFVAIAVGTVAATWGGTVLYEWDFELNAETESMLVDARAEAERARETFETAYGDRLDEATRSNLRIVSESAVETATEGADAFRKECEAILEEADELAAADVDEETRYAEAETLRARAEELAPEERADALADRIRPEIESAVREAFGELRVVSADGTPYELRNLTAFNELRLPSLDGETVHVGGDVHDVGETLAGAVAAGEPLSDVAEAIRTVDEHETKLRERLREEETQLVETEELAENRLEVLEEELDRVPGALGRRLREMLLEGRFESDEGSVDAVEVRERLRAARSELHACDFEAAHREAEAAAEAAESLVAIAEFFVGVAATIDGDGNRLPISAAVPEELAASVVGEVERTYGIDCRIERGAFVFEYDDTSRSFERDDRRTEESTDTEGPEDVLDEILYLFGEIRSSAGTGKADDVVVLDTETMPETIAREAVLEQFERFATSHDAVESVTVDGSVLKLTVVGDRTPRQILSELEETFLKRYGNTE